MDRLADAVAESLAEKLMGPLVPSSIPADVSQAIARAAGYGMHQQKNVIYLAGPESLIADYRLYPDGRLALELATDRGDIFWTGIFRPAGAIAPRDTIVAGRSDDGTV